MSLSLGVLRTCSVSFRGWLLSGTFWTAPHVGIRLASADGRNQMGFAGSGRTWSAILQVLIVATGCALCLMLHAPSHFTTFFTPNAVLSAKAAPISRLPYVSSRVSPVHTPRLPSRKF
jgi:hypothetical protein